MAVAKLPLAKNILARAGAGVWAGADSQTANRTEVAVPARDTGFGVADLARLAVRVQHVTPLWLTNPGRGPDGLSVLETRAYRRV